MGCGASREDLPVEAAVVSAEEATKAEAQPVPEPDPPAPSPGSAEDGNQPTYGSDFDSSAASLGPKSPRICKVTRKVKKKQKRPQKTPEPQAPTE